MLQTPSNQSLVGGGTAAEERTPRHIVITQNDLQDDFHQFEDPKMTKLNL